jgi:hypothetical protein
MKISDSVGGEVGRKASTGSVTLKRVIKANSRWIVQEEMCRRLADEDGCHQADAESSEWSHDSAIVAVAEATYIFEVESSQLK